MLLSGFAKGDTKTVHVIVNANQPLCLSNIKDSNKTMEPEEAYSLNDVSCKKCMRLKFYKDLFLTDSVPQEQHQPPCENQQIYPVKSLIQYIHKLRQKKKKLLRVIKLQNNRILREHLENKKRIQKVESQILLIGKENNIFLNNIIENIRGQFFCKQRADLRYRIYHMPTKKVFFDGLGQDCIIQALTILNSLQTTWDGKNDMPYSFIPTLRAAMKCAFVVSGKPYPKPLDDIIAKHKYLPKNPIKIKRKIIAIKRKDIIKHKYTANHNNFLKRKNIEIVRKHV